MRIILLTVVAGASLGWLVGLSLSPVIGAVLAALLAALIGVVKVVGIRLGETEKYVEAASSVKLLAFLTIGLALGATGGLAARTEYSMKLEVSDSLCGGGYSVSSLSNEIAVWADATNRDKGEIAIALFDVYKEKCKTKSGTPSQSPKDGRLGVGLYSASQKTCEAVLNAGPDDLKTELELSNDKLFVQLSQADLDKSRLRDLVRVVCES